MLPLAAMSLARRAGHGWQMLYAQVQMRPN
jgi:hypothetical protein